MVENPTRRKVVKAAGVAGISVLSVIGSVNAEQPVEKLIRNAELSGEFEEAKEIANDYGMNYNWSKKNIGSNPNDDSKTNTGDLTTLNNWEKPEEGDSYLWISISDPILQDFSDADIKVSGGWKLYENEGILNTRYKTCPKDGSAIFWNDNYFTTFRGGHRNVSVGQDDKANYLFDDISYKETSLDGGILVEIDDPSALNDFRRKTFTSAWSTYLDIAQPGADRYPIKMQYRHNYIDTAPGTCLGITPGLSLGPGGISVNSNVEGWKDSVQTKLD